MEKCRVCGKMTDVEELSEYDGICASCFDKEMQEQWSERKDQEKRGA